MRTLILAAVVALCGACAQARPLPQDDRAAASRRLLAEKQDGDFLTEAELARMDMDRTFLCETEPPTGSRIPRYQCRSLRRVLRERETAQAIAQGSSERASFHISIEAGSNSSVTADLLAASKGKIKKEADAGAPPRPLPTPDQDPRFPPL